MNITDIQNYAEKNHISIARAAIINRHKAATLHQFWPEITSIEEQDDNYSNVRLCEIDLFMTRLATSMSRTYQFPRDTIMLHMMGVITSAMCKSFQVRYYDAKKPCTIYTVTSQPPSTGKSGVNDFLTHPIRKEFEIFNAKNELKRAEVEYRINGMKTELKRYEKRGKTDACVGINTEIEKTSKELDKYPVYIYALNDATIEAVESIASRQGGMFNIVSAEADALNIILGKVYGEGGKANIGVALSAWDGESYSSARVGRNAYNGYIRGCMAVIAQDESINELLTSGAEGRGISERFLMLKERSLLGHRDLSSYTPVDPTLKEEYLGLIENIVQADETLLEVTINGMIMINQYRSDLEPNLSDEGTYSASMIRGFAGKADKHILKIASVIHVSEDWRKGGQKSTVISDNAIAHAIGLFSKLMESYVTAAKQLGHAGIDVEIEKIVDILKTKAEKGKYSLTIKALRDQIKGLKLFKNTPRLTNRLRDQILFDLSRRNYIIVEDNEIFINPRI